MFSSCSITEILTDSWRISILVVELQQPSDVRQYYSIWQKKRCRGSVLPSGNWDWWCSFESRSRLKPGDKCNELIPAPGSVERDTAQSYITIVWIWGTQNWLFKYTSASNINLTLRVILGTLNSSVLENTTPASVTLTNKPNKPVSPHRQNQFLCSFKTTFQTNQCGYKLLYKIINPLTAWLNQHCTRMD